MWKADFSLCLDIDTSVSSALVNVYFSCSTDKLGSRRDAQVMKRAVLTEVSLRDLRE